MSLESPASFTSSRKKLKRENKRKKKKRMESRRMYGKIIGLNWEKLIVRVRRRKGKLKTLKRKSVPKQKRT